MAELDSWAHHGNLAAFRSDRARDRQVWLAGWRPVRVTWWDLTDGPDQLAQELADALA